MGDADESGCVAAQTGQESLVGANKIGIAILRMSERDKIMDHRDDRSTLIPVFSQRRDDVICPKSIWHQQDPARDGLDALDLSGNQTYQEGCLKNRITCVSYKSSNCRYCIGVNYEALKSFALFEYGLFVVFQQDRNARTLADQGVCRVGRNTQDPELF